jgi:aspartate/methionine/tyrosine aminotransferase
VARSPKDLSSRLASSISASPTLEISSLAAALRAEGRDVIAFAAGEPDLPTPEPVRRAAIRAVEGNQGRYTSAAGLPDLRKAIATRLTRTGTPYGPDEVICTAGGKPAIYEALLAVIEPGEEVLFPTPYWGSYADIVRAARGVPVTFETRVEEGFIPDVGRLAAAVTPRTRLLILNSPNNPTGAVYPHEVLREIAAYVRDSDLLVLSDDIYEHLVYTETPFANILHVAPDLKQRTLLVNGFSKSDSMTGWRLGWTSGPRAAIAAMARIQSQIAGCPSAISQLAALGGIEVPLDPARKASFDRRRRLLVGALQAVPRLRVPVPDGAFYVFPDFSAWLGLRHRGQSMETTEDLSRAMLDERLVATVPGEAFGAPGHLRLTYTCPEDRILEGVERIAGFLNALEG